MRFGERLILSIAESGVTSSRERKRPTNPAISRSYCDRVLRHGKRENVFDEYDRREDRIVQFGEIHQIERVSISRFGKEYNLRVVAR